jgi:hypothetical protein
VDFRCPPEGAASGFLITGRGSPSTGASA